MLISKTVMVKSENKEKEISVLMKNKIKKLVSFWEWCYLNLPKELADWILSRWDNELNVDRKGNKLTPKDIGYASHGIDRKGYWFKCIDRPEHGSELKSVSNFTQGGGNITCNQCNLIYVTHPHLVKYLVNKEDAYKYSKGSVGKILVKCPDCGHERIMDITNLVYGGFSCSRCSDGISYPEKFITNVFEQLNRLFQTQLSKTSFKWCGSYKYDFYINEFNGICEAMGLQHYEESRGNWGSLKDIQENDKDKEQLAKQNSINNYIVIDCRYSDMEWIKNNIMNRDPSRPDQPCLAELLDFKEDDIDWLKCDEFACSSRVKEVCNIWGKGIKNTLKISEELKLGYTTVLKYLNKGVKLGWCNYNPKEANYKNSKEIICLTTGEIFDSIAKASKGRKDKPNIVACCKGKLKSAGKHPETGEKLVWMYYEEYLELKK